MTILQHAGYTGNELVTLNRCRITNKMLFLSDVATACSRYINCTLLGPLAPWLGPRSTYTFPQEVPSSKNWLLWRTFWTSYSGPGGLLHIPLGEWLHPSHRIWEWFYDPIRDQVSAREKQCPNSIQANPDQMRFTAHPTLLQALYQLQLRNRQPMQCTPAITYYCSVPCNGAPAYATQRESRGTFREHLQ